MFAPPRNGSRRFSPPAPFRRLCACGRGEGISRSAERDQGLCPVDLATFEKVDETFPWRLRRLSAHTVGALNHNLPP